MSIGMVNNALIPGSIEFGKNFKPLFNSGCMCTICNQTSVPTCTTKIQAFTRNSRDESLVTEIVNDYYCPCQKQALTADCT